MDNLTTERAIGVLTPMYTNMTKFWGRYYDSATAILQPSFVSKMYNSNSKHWTYVKRKVDEGSSTVEKWIADRQQEDSSSKGPK